MKAKRVLHCRAGRALFLFAEDSRHAVVARPGKSSYRSITVRTVAALLKSNVLTVRTVDAKDTRNALTVRTVDAKDKRNALTVRTVHAKDKRNALTVRTVDAKDKRNALTVRTVDAKDKRNALTVRTADAKDTRNALTVRTVDGKDARYALTVRTADALPKCNTLIVRTADALLKHNALTVRTVPLKQITFNTFAFVFGLRLKTDPRWENIPEANLTFNTISLITRNTESEDMVHALTDIAIEGMQHFKFLIDIIRPHGHQGASTEEFSGRYTTDGDVDKR